MEVLYLGKLGEGLNSAAQKKNQNIIQCYMEHEREFVTDWRYWVNKSRWARNVARMGQKSSAYILVEKSGCKKPLGRPRCRWDDNRETGFQDRMSEHRLDSAG